MTKITQKEIELRVAIAKANIAISILGQLEGFVSGLVATTEQMSAEVTQAYNQWKEEEDAKTPASNG